MLAHVLAVAEGAHQHADILPVPPRFGDPAVVGYQLQFRLRLFQGRIGQHRGFRQCIAEDVLGQLGRAGQGLPVPRLQVDLDHAIAAETGEQVALGGVMIQVGQVGKNFFLDDPFQFLHPTLVLGAHAHAAAAGPGEDVVVLQRRLALTAHERGDALRQYVHVFPGDGAFTGARGIPEIGVHRVALYRRQVIQLRQQGGGEGQRQGDQCGHECPAFARGAGDAHHEVGDALPQPGVVILQVLLLQPGLGCQRHDGNRDQRGDDHGDSDGDSQVGEQLALDLAHEQHRQENGHRGGGGCQQRTPYLGGALQRRLRRRQTLLPQAHYVFHHHNGRIQHHADREGQPRQRNNVQGAPGQPQHDECGKQ